MTDLMKINSWDELMVHDGVRALLRMMGEDPNRDGLRGTPARVVKAFMETVATTTTPAELLATTFEMDADEIVLVGPCSFTSICEHHLLPFHGQAWISYIPQGGRVVGLSKLPRLLDYYAARPQIQERLTTQVADAIEKHLTPQGTAVIIKSTHTCMTLRGARKAGAMMTTSVVHGSFRHEPEARAELFALLEV